MMLCAQNEDAEPELIDVDMALPADDAVVVDSSRRTVRFNIPETLAAGGTGVTGRRSSARVSAARLSMARRSSALPSQAQADFAARSETATDLPLISRICACFLRMFGRND